MFFLRNAEWMNPRTTMSKYSWYLAFVKFSMLIPIGNTYILTASKPAKTGFYYCPKSISLASFARVYYFCFYSSESRSYLTVFCSAFFLFWLNEFKSNVNPSFYYYFWFCYPRFSYIFSYVWGSSIVYSISSFTLKTYYSLICYYSLIYYYFFYFYSYFYY